MGRTLPDREAYEKVCGVCKKQGRRHGLTAADITARTALPLEQVRDLVTQAADEYSGRLEVTESGEIRYSFPRGFTSKYRGIGPALRKITGKIKKLTVAAGTALFKVWIMVMLLGYFLLFMLIALGAMVISLGGGSNNSSDDRRGGGFGGVYLASSLFNTIIRIWFYSEIFAPSNNRYREYGRPVVQKPKGKPLHRAIFSFVFGDGDPNRDFETRQRQAVIAYIQANRGVISLPEFMALTGFTADEAGEELSAYCARYGGCPECTEDGTILYQFKDLLKRADQRDRSFGGLSGPLMRERLFSGNTKGANRAFALINGVNLLFGGYFLYNALHTGQILTQAHFNASSYLYGVTYMLSSRLLLIQNPLPLITVGLGLVPLAFSALFWLIPALRSRWNARKNREIQRRNVRISGFNRIWQNPLSVKAEEIVLLPAPSKGMGALQNAVIKDMGSYSQPELRVDERGETVYSFKDLEREKESTERFRSGIDGGDALGETVFDSDGGKA